MNNKSFYIILLAILSIVSCDKDSNKKEGTEAFFGGEIINPFSDYIILSKSSKIIDTISLDKKNRFAYKLTQLDPGMYSFFDGREAQTFLLEPNDSLLIRLNTFDFDESLVYTGIGSKENNFLIDLFLENENEDNRVFSISQLEPVEFIKELNGYRDKNIKKLEQFNLKNKPTDLFKEIAKANIDYRYYANKELYPLANYRKSERKNFNNLPDDFYDFRENIDYDNDLLKNNEIYKTFLRFHINNIALQEHFKHSKDSVYDELSLDYNLDKLKIIDKNIDNEDIKNDLLNYTIIHFINISKNTDDYDILLKSYKEKSTDKQYIDKATRIVNSYKRLKPGQKIPPLTLLDSSNNEIELHSLIKKPTVIYFWTKNSKSRFIDSHKRVKELEVKYPEFNYIAINTDSISYSEQVNILKRTDLRINNEYRFKFPAKSKDVLSIRPINKVFIVNKKQQIVNAKANMFNISFEQELLGLINQ